MRLWIGLTVANLFVVSACSTDGSDRAGDTSGWSTPDSGGGGFGGNNDNKEDVGLVLSAPAPGTVYDVSEPVSLIANLTGAQDPKIYSIRWSSDKIGHIGSKAFDGSGFAAMDVNFLPAGTHVLTAVALRGDQPSAQQAAVIIVNGPPSAPVVAIVPNSPGTNDNLVAEIVTGSTDPNPSDSVTYGYSWFVDGVAKPELTGPTVLATHTSVGQTWEVRILPFDGRLYGPLGSATTVIVNAKPTIQTVQVQPSSGTATTTFTCTALNVSDPDDDPITLSYIWKNGEIQVGTGDTLAPPNFKKGDQLVCVVTPSDPFSTGTEVASPPVPVQNTAPEVESVTLTPEFGDKSTLFQCTPGPATDIDNDPVSFDYTWIVNGEELPGTTSNTLSAQALSKGDTLLCRVTPKDGGNSGTPKDSPQAMVVNSGPQVGSVVIVPAKATVETTLSCIAANMTDPDNDPLSFTYTWTVNGTTVEGAVTDTLAGAFVRGDLIGCEIVVNDGQAQSAPKKAKDYVTIQNALPVANGITLTPPIASLADTLFCQVESTSDADGDSVTLSYLWEGNGQLIPGQAQPTLKASVVPSNTTVVCIVTPHDGLQPGISQKSPSAEVKNQKPIIDSVVIQPPNAFTTSELTCVVSGVTDGDGEPVSLSYAWTLNGTALANQTDAKLSGDWFAKGDSVSCVVTPSDPYETGSAKASPAVVIQNSTPSVSSATIDPPGGKKSLPFQCLAQGFFDADQDGPSHAYAWQVNGVLVEGASNKTFDATGLNNGDQLVCILTPGDGEGFGTPVQSAAVTIVNNAPKVVSANITPKQPLSSEDLLCTPDGWSDPDGDLPQYQYTWLVDGAALPEQNEAVLDAAATTKGTDVVCKVTPFDGSATGAPVVSPPVTILNTPPEAPKVAFDPPIPQEDAALSCVIIEPAFDIDNDPLTYSYTWTVDGATVPNLKDPVIAVPKGSACAEWACSVIAFDGEAFSPAAGATGVVPGGGMLAPAGKAWATASTVNPPAGNDGWTLEAWARRDTDKGGTIVARAGVGQSAVLLGVANNGAPVLTVRSETGTLVGEAKSVTPLPLGTWVHIAGQRSAAGTLTLYVEGMQVGVGNANPSLSNPSGAAWIGAGPSTGQPTDIWPGMVDEVRLSSIARYPTNFTPKGPFDADSYTPALWHFDEKAGVNAYDYSGNQAHATLVPGPAWNAGSPWPVCLGGTGNIPPTAPLVSVSPNPAFTTDKLTCSVVVDSVDFDGDPFTYQVNWTLFGELMPQHKGQWTLSASETAKGQKWACEVAANDGKVNGAKGIGKTTVFNSVPTITKAEITPTTAVETSTLACNYTGWLDADGDPANALYSWKVGTTTVAGAVTPQLTGTHFDKGDTVVCTVTPFDGNDLGAPVSSAPVTVLNTPPVGPVLEVVPAEPLPGTPLQCITVTPPKDVDGDSLTYTYKWLRDGLAQPDLTSSTVPSGVTGECETWTCQVIIHDGETSSAPTSAQTQVLGGSSASLGQFGGTIVVPASAALDITGPLTAEAWLRIPEGFSPKKHSRHFSIMDRGSYRLLLNAHTGKLQFELTPKGPKTWKKVWDAPTARIEALHDYSGLLYIGLGAEKGESDIYQYDGVATTKIFDGVQRRIGTFAVHNGALYAGQGSLLAGAGDVFSLSGSTWTLNYNGFQEDIPSLASYKGKIYAGQGIDNGDAELFALDTAWNKIHTFAGYQSVRSLAIAGPLLYAGLGDTLGQSDIFSHDGTGWEKVYDGTEERVQTMELYRSELYAGLLTLGAPTGAGDILRLGPDGFVVDYYGSDNGIYDMEVYNGELYAGVGSEPTGNAQLLRRTAQGWIVEKPFDTDAVVSLGTYNGKLVAGTGVSPGDGSLWEYGDNVVLTSKVNTWNADTWYHVAAVYTGTTMRLFINGKLDSEGPAPANIITSGSQLRMGDGHTNHWFLGSLDEIRLSSTVRYTSNFVPPVSYVPDAATVGLWHLDEGKGTVIHDVSANKLHGKLVNASWMKDAPGESCNATAQFPPSKPGIGLVPAAPLAQDPITCVITAESDDLNNDPVTYQFQWFKNGELQPAHTNAVLPAKITQVCEIWTCSVTPTDGKLEGVPTTVSTEVMGGLKSGSMAASFDGTGGSFVAKGAQHLVQPGALTVEAWVRPKTTLAPYSAHHNENIIETGGFNLVFDYRTGRVQFTMQTGTNWDLVAETGGTVTGFETYLDTLFAAGSKANKGVVWALPGGNLATPVLQNAGTAIRGLVAWDEALFAAQEGPGDVLRFDGANWQGSFSTDPAGVTALWAHGGELYAAHTNPNGVSVREDNIWKSVLTDNTFAPVALTTYGSQLHVAMSQAGGSKVLASTPQGWVEMLNTNSLATGLTVHAASLVLAAGSGVLQTNGLAEQTLPIGEIVTAVAWHRGRLAAGTTAGNVWFKTADGTWETSDASLGSKVTALRSLNGRLYAGTEAGVVWAYSNTTTVQSLTEEWLPGTYRHIAAVLDGTSLKLYVDGQEEDSATVSAPGPVGSTGRLVLGDGDGNQYFYGDIDEVRISKTARYTSNFVPQKALLYDTLTLGLWHLDGSGADVAQKAPGAMSGAVYTDGVGATCNLPVPPAAGTLWITDRTSGVLLKMNLGGSLLSSPQSPVGAPVGIAADPTTGDLWVHGEAKPGTLYRLSSSGTLKQEVPKSGGATSGQPRGLAWEPEKARILALETNPFGLVVTSAYTTTGSLAYSLTTSAGAGQEQRSGIWPIGDSGKERLITHRKEGTIETWSNQTLMSKMPVPLKDPRGIVIHPDKTMYLLDGSSKSVYRLAQDGTVLMAFQVPAKDPTDLTLTVP